LERWKKIFSVCVAVISGLSILVGVPALSAGFPLCIGGGGLVFGVGFGLPYTWIADCMRTSGAKKREEGKEV
jgi:hypothetical protein